MNVSVYRMRALNEKEEYLMKTRRVLALVLAAVLCVSGVSLPAKAQDLGADASDAAVTAENFDQEGIHVYREGSKGVEELLAAVTIDEDGGQTGNAVTEKSFDKGGKEEPDPEGPKEEETPLPELTGEERAFLDKSGCTVGLNSFKERFPDDFENMKKVYEDMEKKCREFTVNGRNAVPTYYVINEDGTVEHPYYEAFVLKIDDKYRLSFQQATELYFTFRADNPQYFWLSNSVYPRGIRRPGEEAIATELNVASYGEYYNGEDRKAKFSLFAMKLREEYFDKVDPEEDSRYDMLLTLHDTLIQKTVYPAFEGDEYTPACHSVAGVLDRGYAVCEGYAKMMQIMMNHYGIGNYYVTGFAYPAGTDSEPELHAWNYVEMDGAWYGLDATWDDQEWDGFWHTYFLVGKKTGVFNDMIFEDDHIPDTPEKINENYLYPLPELAEERYVYVPPVVVKPGDPTGDGVVNLMDLRLVLRQVCGKVKLEENAFSAADVNGDGKVDLVDLRLILRFVCGKISEF